MTYIECLFGLCDALPAHLGRKNSLGNVGKLGKAFFQVGVSLQLDATLIRPLSSRSTFAIPGVHAIHDIHTFDYFANGRKALLVQERIALFTRVDKDLRGS